MVNRQRLTALIDGGMVPPRRFALEEDMRQVTAIGVLGFAAAAFADITVTVVPSSAPNVYGSPSWGTYVTNSLFALENGLTQVGDRETDPTAYQAITDGVLRPGDIMVTSFKSWRKYTNPGVVWGPQFAGEYGNRMHFGLHIMGDGTEQFCLEDLEFEISSTDGNVLGFAGDFVGFGYASTRHGIDWGPDRIRGTADDIRYTSGNGTTPVDELVYVGVGNAYWPQPATGQSEEDAIHDAIVWMRSQGVQVTGEYSITGKSGGVYGDATTLVIPSPAPLAVCGVFGLALVRRRTRSGV